MDAKTCLNQFRTEYQHRFKVGTLKNYCSDINQFLQYEDKAIDKITKRDIRNWLTFLSTEKGYLPSTLNNKIKALKNFFCFCREEGFIPQDIAKDINFVYREEKLPRYLTKEQLTALRELLKGKIQERAVMEVLYCTGVRISELIAMKKSDVNWTERTITIPNGKGDVGRYVLFTSECEQHLKAYLDSRTDDLPDVFVLSNTVGVTKHPNVVGEWFRYYSRSLGVKVSPHTMRHTFAAHLAQKGMPLECIQELMGHANFQTTRIYAKLYDHARKEMYDEWM
ncbi:tyrosine-type recombinase/integrase [Sporosarcina sp. FSL W8-0480]|uniref:tyrosine-type recombinase/integrase n=1 Tax=Sporosarcina sp. FSL W8-0480 TaxID=2954701 RepID=UPI0030DBCB4A